MVMNETKSQTMSQDSKLKNFGKKIHKFTSEERSNGGKNISDKKRMSNAFNSMKTGKYSNKVPHCNTCIFRNQCSAYDSNDPKAACKIINIPNYAHLLSALTFRTEEDFDTFVSKQVQRMYLKNLTTEDWDKLRDFILLLLKLRETKYKSPKEQTINIQINNFQSEFAVFKDITLKILKKHPDVMLEWREALESTKRSN